MITDEDLDRELILEADRRREWFLGMAEKHPERVREMIYGFLGDSIGYADIAGIDVLKFIAELRASGCRPARPVRPRPRGRA